MIKIFYDEDLDEVYYSGIIESGIRGESVASNNAGLVEIYNNKLEAFIITATPFTDFVDSTSTGFANITDCVNYLNGELGIPIRGGGIRNNGNAQNIRNVVELTEVVTTDADGMFTMSTVGESLVEVLDTTATLVDQVFTAASDVTTLAQAVITSVTPTAIDGVVITATNPVINLLGDTAPSVARAGAGRAVRVTMRGRR